MNYQYANNHCNATFTQKLSEGENHLNSYQTQPQAIELPKPERTKLSINFFTWGFSFDIQITIRRFHQQ